MSENNEQFMPFRSFNCMNQTNGNAPAPVPMFPMLNLQAMNQMSLQALNQKLNQIQAYFCRMAQTGATMLCQLHMEHITMLQQAAEQDKELMERFEKVWTKEEDNSEEPAKTAEKKANK